MKRKTRGRKRSRKRSVSTIFKWKTFHGHRWTLKLPSEFIPESPQNTLIEASTFSYKNCNLPDTGQPSSAGKTAENLPF